MSDKNVSVVQRFMKFAGKIEPDEIKAVVLSFTLIFVLMTSNYILRPVRDSMSSDWTDAELSALYTATFIFSAIAVAIYGAVCSRFKIERIVPSVYGFFSLSFFVFYAASHLIFDSSLVDKIFYVWTSVFILFQVSVFWSLLADIFSKEQAPRLFGFITAGSSAGAIAGPAISLSLVNIIGRNDLILIPAVLLIIPMLLTGVLRTITSAGPGPKASISGSFQSLGPNPFAGFVQFVRNPYLLGIGVFILLYTSISTIVYFELKNLMVDVDENTRVQIWAGMDLAVNVLAIGVAMFGTSRLATRFGLAVTLALVPVVIVAGLLVVAFAPMLFVVVGLQVVRRFGNYAITRPGREMLYTVVDRESRYKAKSVIDIVVYRGGDMATAWAFTGLTQGLGLGLGAVAAVGAGIAAIWVVVATFLGKAFARAPVHSAASGTAIPIENPVH